MSRHTLASLCLASTLASGTTAATPEPSRTLELAQMRLLVCDFAAARHFYRDVLGLPVEFEAGQYIEFRTGAGATLGIFPQPLMPGVANECPRSSTTRNNYSVVVLRVPNVTAAAAFLEAQRVPQVLPPQDRPEWGLRTAHFLDPAGNLVELIESLPATTS